MTPTIPIDQILKSDMRHRDAVRKFDDRVRELSLNEELLKKELSSNGFVYRNAFDAGCGIWELSDVALSVGKKLEANVKICTDHKSREIEVFDTDFSVRTEEQ